jgi:ATP-binding cassette subfamily B protein
MMARFRRKKKEFDEDEDEEVINAKTLTILKRLLQYVGLGNKKLVYPLIILIIFNIVFSWFTPLIFRALIDDGLGGSVAASTGNVDIIIFLGTLFFAMTIAGVITRIAQGYIIQKLATITMYNLRDELFGKMLRLGLDYHDSPKKTVGKKINYITGDVNTIQELIQSGLLVSVSNFFLIFGALFFMILLSPMLTLVAFILVPILFSIGGLIFSKARKFFNELRERVATVTSTLDESIMGMRIIQSFAVEDENYEEFSNATELEKETTMKAAKLMAFMPGIIMMTITLGLGILFFTAGVLIHQGDLSQGTLVAFIFYVFTFFEPLFSLLGFLTLLQNSIAAGARIVRLLDEEPAINEKLEAMLLNNIQGKIVYDNVNFSYEENVPVLTDINVLIKEKERLAIVGYTGAGKSTFIKLLSRFYDPTEGSIKIDDINLKDVNIKSLRTNMGIVLQDNFLFSGTIMENIRYGKMDATDEEIFEAAKLVSAHDFIMELEKGYDTFVGERGSHLSEGERQLIAFTRTIIADPPILILDEATSSIDPYSELLIQQALETLLKGRTSISIAHRLSTIINSDRILVLDKGKIIEEGSHQELVEKNGFYKHLFDMSFHDPFKEEAEKEELEFIDTSREYFQDKKRF